MYFVLDLRFVFVLRYLYRQGKKKIKPQKPAGLADFWEKQKTNKKII